MREHNVYLIGGIVLLVLGVFTLFFPSKSGVDAIFFVAAIILFFLSLGVNPEVVGAR